MKKWIISLLLTLSATLHAEPVVVVSASSELTVLTQDEVRQLFNGLTRRASGVALKPLDLPAKSTERTSFYQQVLGKSAEQMKSYWARMIFTGRGMPPREVSSNREMVMLIGSNRNFIGYVDETEVTPQLKVVYRP
ncbi:MULTISPECIES: hypothetical protein [unclassified Alcanivorax]|jgi:hypothetical protein|uniref:hypothetical protein n=1 Tax=unclassified Alcanivorax TaxID=2638842 RepID=UPI0007B89B82|nr:MULTISPECIES: hypothetical protein [unclassified Alcanivorax]